MNLDELEQALSPTKTVLKNAEKMLKRLYKEGRLIKEFNLSYKRILMLLEFYNFVESRQVTLPQHKGLFTEYQLSCKGYEIAEKLI